MSFDEPIRSYNFINNENEPCKYMNITRSAITFLFI